MQKINTKDAQSVLGLGSRAGIVGGLVQQSHKHHYVPEWYQRRFLADGQIDFTILDLQPEDFRDASGRVRGHSTSIFHKGPKAWFWEPDLYTVKILGREDDVIERMLFGAIDTKGREAIDALVEENWNLMHFTYRHVFEFLDALRLRTPKGLAFVKRLFRVNDQQDLMVQMQLMRQMHCVMWMEGAREIFSAEQSSVKFIFSDHPVTFFNRLVFPGDIAIPKDQDPHLDWQGTQTIFPLDRNRLLVLTHREWGRNRNPGRHTARTSRTNPRYFDNSMVSYHDIERSRTLTEQQVLEVNYIIKNRALRYIAGQSEGDLFPEKHLKTTMWNKLGLFLMPTSYSVAPQVGYMVLGMKDGTQYFQDEFGRRPQTRAEWETAQVEACEMKAHIDKVLAAHAAKKNGAPSAD